MVIEYKQSSLKHTHWSVGGVYLEAGWLKTENLDALQQIFLHLLRKGVGDVFSTLTFGPRVI